MLPASERKYLHAILETGAELEAIERLESAFGSFEAAWRASESALKASGVSAARAEAIAKTAASQNPDERLRKLVSLGISLSVPGDPDFPPELLTIASPPRFLYIKGSIRSDRPRLAVVGTRKASSYGLAATEKIIRALADRIDIVIVSGLALGTDAAAHRAALANSLATIGVLGSGIDRAAFYPSANYGLAEEMTKQRSAVMSEYPPGSPPLRHHFIARNRLIAALSLGTLVIEAPEKSGALITANFALEQGREVFAIPGPVFSESAAGVNRLIQDGAKLVSKAEDILEELGLAAERRSSAAPGAGSLGELETRILSFLGQPRNIDDLKRELGAPTPEIMSALTSLELSGRIRGMGGGSFQRIV